MMVNFKPGKYMRRMFIQSVTQATRKKIRVLPTGGEPMTFWLLVVRLLLGELGFFSEWPVSLTE